MGHRRLAWSMCAAPPVGFGRDDDAEPSESADLIASYELFARVRTVRADVQDFERSLDVLAAACEAARAAGDDHVLAVAIEREEPNFQRLKQHVENTLYEIAVGLENNPRLRSDVSDEVTHISNRWNRVICDWPTSGTSREEVETRIDFVRGSVRQILVHAARLTAADRLNRHLDSVRIGKTAVFDNVFADEIPDPDDRRALLTYLSEHPAAVHGVIDTGRGLVFRTSQSAKVRVATYLTPILAATAGALVVYTVGKLDDWLDLSDWPAGLSDSRTLLVAYFFVLLGALVHVGVEALKQQRFGAGTSFLALDDILDWMHIRYLSISASVLWIFVGVFGLGLTTTNIAWGTAFLVGYSLDSIGGLFLQRFGQAVERRRETLTGSLTG
jgi:hypothetical protein